MIRLVDSRIDNFVDLLGEQARKYGNKPAFSFLDDGVDVAETVSYDALAKRAYATAVTLQQEYPVGSRVLLMYPSCIDYMVAFFGCICAGMIAVPVFPPRGNKHNSRVEGIISDSQTKVALTTTRQLQQIKMALQSSPELSSLKIICTDTIDESHGDNWQRPTVNNDTLAYLQYTSGSTGQPKGVMISHGNMLYNERMIQSVFRSHSENIYMTWLPIYHDMGLIGNMLHAFWLGATCYFMAPTMFLQRPIRWLQAIDRYRASLSGGPNFSYQLCVDKINLDACSDMDLSCWEVAFNGSEPVRNSTLKKFSNKFSAVGFKSKASVPCYGMAEATLIVTGGTALVDPNVLYVDQDMMKARLVAPASEDVGTPLVSCGETIMEQTIRIVDPSSGMLCRADQVGEIWIAGPHVGKGYWNRPDTTRETFEAYIADIAEGPFLRTGDLGFMHNMELYVAGRLKDVMIVRGVNYYPQDIEASVEAIDESINTAGSAAFTVIDESGENVVVVVEIKRTYLTKIISKDVIAKIRQSIMEQYGLMLSDVVLIKPSSLPKTSSGKVQRASTRNLYMEDALALVDGVELVEA